MGWKVMLEFDKIDNKFIYLKNIIMNAYSDIFVSFHNKNCSHKVEHGTQAVIKGAHKVSMS